MAIEGPLRELGIHDVFQLLDLSRKTGALRVTSDLRDDEGDVLRLVTETEAGWYRYVMEWRLHLDGTIEPVFGFGAVSNSCTCNEHHHHAYWRFEFALDGVAGNGATGICTLDRRTPGTSTQWTAVSTEGSFVRPPADPASDHCNVRPRLRHHSTLTPVVRCSL